MVDIHPNKLSGGGSVWRHFTNAAPRSPGRREVAEILGCSKKTVYNGRAGTDKLTRIRSGRKYVGFLLSEVLALAEKQEKEARQVTPPEDPS